MTEMQTVILILEIGFVVMGLGFTALGTLILHLHSCTNKRIDGVCARIDKLDEKVMDTDRRLCRIEGAMMNRECCMLSASHPKQKAE